MAADVSYNELPPFAWQGRDRGWSTAGENSRVSTLTTEQVVAIKRFVLTSDHRSDAKTAEVFGVTRSTIANIRTGRRWSHVRLDPSPVTDDVTGSGST